MTREKVWTKSVEIGNQSVSVKTEKMYASSDIPYDILYKDPGFYNPVAELLEKFYQKTMQKSWNYLDPEELELLKPQIEKIRENSGYGRKTSR